jgi:UDP-N-acetylmuramyl pentapeptide phosphotransferase/UDP-N-acetylglucosamine-1-phosphate transferase
MLNLAISFGCSFLAIYLIVRSENVHARFTLDGDLDGVQKNHAYAVPRVGGAGIACGAIVVALTEWLWLKTQATDFALMLLCAIPACGSGIVEDLTKRVSVKVRLSSALVSALAGAYLIHAVILRVDLPLFDQGLHVWPLAIGLTMLGVAGLTNAINIIDGFNGLAAIVSMAIFASIGYVAYQVSDVLIMSISLTMLGALGGFVIWNYPVPSIFLGDGGAYLVGFTIAESLLLLIARHPGVSAWYAAVVVIYPVTETLFSIYRRTIVRGRTAGEPDGLHLHTLVYRRIVGKGPDSESLRQRTRRNSRTSIYLWMLNFIGVIPATLFWNARLPLAFTMLVFVTCYVWLYCLIVRFKAPRWLLLFGRDAIVVSTKVEQTRN